MRELEAAVFVHWGPSILGFWEIFKWITTEWENGGSGVSGGNSVGSTMGNFTRCYWATLTWVTQWESLSAPWRGSPPGSPFSGKEKSICSHPVAVVWPEAWWEKLDSIKEGKAPASKFLFKHKLRLLIHISLTVCFLFSYFSFTFFVWFLKFVLRQDLIT